MQHRLMDKKFVISGLISLFMLFFSTAKADSNHYGYSLLLAGGGNPWAIPEAKETYPDFQQPPMYENQQSQGEVETRSNHRQTTQPGMYQGNRFVTDEFLKSLKQQQSQFQVMPDQRRYPKHAPRPKPNTSLSNPGTYDYPSYGTGYVDPLVDTLSDVPVVTPWTPWDIGVSDW